MNVSLNKNSGVAGLANIGIAAAFGAILVNADQTLGAFLEAGNKERSSSMQSATPVPETDKKSTATGKNASTVVKSASPVSKPKETYNFEGAEGTVKPKRKVSDNEMAILQAGRAFIMVCLFGIFFMCTATPLVAKKRIFPMRSFTFLLVFLASLAFFLQIYMMRNIKTGLEEGDRTVRFYTSLIYMIFLFASAYVMVSF